MHPVTFTTKARFALDSLGGRKRTVLRVLNRLRSFDPDHPDGANKIEHPHPLFMIRASSDVNAFFRPLSSGGIEIVDLIREEAAESIRAEAEQPA